MDQPLIVLGKLMGSTVTSESIYFTDGRGETNENQFGPGSSSKTTWEGDRIVVRSSRRKESGQRVTTEITETWALSSDAKLLTKTTTVVSAAGTRTLTEAFKRVESRR